jgi:hypothetical protein
VEVWRQGKCFKGYLGCPEGLPGKGSAALWAAEGSWGFLEKENGDEGVLGNVPGSLGGALGLSVWQ